MFGWARDLLNRLAADPRHVAPRVPISSRTLAGVSVTPDSAVTIAAVWACLRYLSQTVAVLPWHVMREGKSGAHIQDRHPIDWLLWKRPNPEWSSFQFRETLTHWALRWGNGYAEIEPDQLDRPFALWPIHPERVQCCRATEEFYSSYGDEIAAGQLYYEVNNGAGPKIFIAAKRMFHVRGFGEGPVGVNVISYAAQSLGWARAAQLFGAAFFGNGMNPAGVIALKNPMSPEGKLRLEAEIEQKLKGPYRANKWVLIDNDPDFKPIGTEPAKAQLLELHQHLVEEICRWFGVPPHKVMHLLRATFSNIEHQAIEVVVDSVSPWVKRFEDEADYKLFGQNRPGLYTKMNMRALLRGDTTARVAYYDGMVKIGAYSPNRVLELEDENTIGDAGNIHVMQNQNVTLEQIAAGVGIPAKPTPSPPDPVNDPDQNDPVGDVANARTSALLRELADA